MKKQLTTEQFKQFIQSEAKKMANKPESKKKIVKEAVEYESLLKSLKANLAPIEEKISKAIGTKVKLTAEVSGNRFLITSKPLSLSGNPIANTLFSEMTVEFWGGSITDDNNIWFAPKLAWKYKSGGTNGADLIWSGLWFSPVTNKWIERTIN